MKSGKLIAAGYTKPLYNVPIYKKMKPKNGCPNVEEIIIHPRSIFFNSVFILDNLKFNC